MDKTKTGEENFEAFLELIDSGNTDWNSARDVKITFDEQWFNWII